MIGNTAAFIVEDVRAGIAQNRVGRLEQETSQSKLVGKRTAGTEQASFMTQLLSNIVFKGFAVVVCLQMGLFQYKPIKTVKPTAIRLT